MSDPQRQCAALQHTMGVLQEVLRSHVELLVGRHLDQLLVAVLFCVCEVCLHSCVLITPASYIHIE